MNKHITKGIEEMQQKAKKETVETNIMKSEVETLLNKREADIINKYKNNLPNFLQERNDEISQEIRELIKEKEARENITSYEPIIMKLIARPFRRFRC